jgi:hypothetical protein
MKIEPLMIVVTVVAIHAPTSSAQQNVGTNRAQSAVQGQPQQVGYSTTPWFSDPQLQQQLNLSPQQMQALNQAYGNAVNEYNQGVNGIPSNQALARRQERMQRLQARYNQSFGRALDSAFTNPQSRQRFDQLNRQYQGYGAFNDPQLQQQMSLTPAQQQQFAAYQNQFQAKLQQLQAMGANNPAAQQQFLELQQQAHQQIGQTLTPQQQQAWQQQIGKVANFPIQSYPGGNPPNPVTGPPGVGQPGIQPRGGAAGAGGAPTGARRGGAGAGGAGGTR